MPERQITVPRIADTEMSESAETKALSKIFEQSLPLTDKAAPKDVERANKIKELLDRVDLVASDIGRAFAKACHGKVEASSIKVYLVGGRLKVQPIRARSDFDFIVTGPDMKSVDKGAVLEVQTMFNNAMAQIEKKFALKGMIDTPLVQFVSRDEEFLGSKKSSPALLLHEESLPQ
jgi:hypothetical protein